jgi:hypothetical protein
MTTAKRLLKNKNALTAYKESLYRVYLDYGSMTIVKFVFIDGSALVWRSYGFGDDGLWSAEK